MNEPQMIYIGMDEYDSESRMAAFTDRAIAERGFPNVREVRLFTQSPRRLPSYSCMATIMDGKTYGAVLDQENSDDELDPGFGQPVSATIRNVSDGWGLLYVRGYDRTAVREAFQALLAEVTSAKESEA